MVSVSISESEMNYRVASQRMEMGDYYAADDSTQPRILAKVLDTLCLLGKQTTLPPGSVSRNILDPKPDQTVL
jgi:hypothetical protein